MKSPPIPVWLVTGYLGSGKTTLLASWLRDPALADAALVVNEIGEVTLDERLLANASDSAALIANACVCCTGLPGLEEAMRDLWWDRLQRRRPRFGAVVIETTGLADPWPVIEMFGDDQRLGERYRLAGVVTAASATAGCALVEGHAEAQAQITAADAVVITKTDVADGTSLADFAGLLNPRAAIAVSANASLAWPDVSALVAARADRPTAPHSAESAGHHHHHAQARFVALPDPTGADALDNKIRELRSEDLLRLKGVVRLADGGLHTVQWALGDDASTLRPFDGGAAPRLGLTCITATTEPAG